MTQKPIKSQAVLNCITPPPTNVLNARIVKYTLLHVVPCAQFLETKQQTHTAHHVCLDLKVRLGVT